MIEGRDYRSIVQELDLKFKDFMFSAERGSTNKYHALMARKEALRIKGLLKEFRQFSLKNDKERIIPRPNRRRS
jgi:hypothetical protein